MKVYPGSHVDVKVKIEQRQVSESFKTLPFHVRKCRLTEEQTAADSGGGGSLFQFYTQKSCQFECLLNSAKGVCGCSPWNFPLAGMDGDQICQGKKSLCFQEQMGQSKALKVRFFLTKQLNDQLLELDH